MRLALEDADAADNDVARTDAGLRRMMALMASKHTAARPFAPPFLRDRSVIVGQTANILLYLGGRLA